MIVLFAVRANVCIIRTLLRRTELTRSDAGTRDAPH